MDAPAKLTDPDDDPKKAIKQFAKVSARVMGVSAALFVILAKDDIAPAYFDTIGKVMFWTGGVLLPLLNFNRDVLRFPSAILTTVVLLALHAVLIFSMFGRLESFNFIVLTLLCLVQCVIFFVPLW